VTQEAVLEFAYATPEQARIVERSVRQEAGAIDGDRTRATVERNGATVDVAIEAADFVALRAGLNTWLSLVDVAETCADATPHPIDSDPTSA
jgi:KEOPS complex subunit Pcc1